MYNCKYCNYSTDIKCNFKTHLKSKRHHKNSTSTNFCSVPAQFCSVSAQLCSVYQNPKQDDVSEQKIKQNIVYKCPQCEYSTDRLNNLNRHIKSCLKSKLDHNQIKIIEKLTEENKKLKDDNLRLQEETKKYKDELVELKLKHSIEMLEKENTLLKKHAKAMTNKTTNYIINNYTNAPNLEPPTEIKDFEKYSYKGIQTGFSELINDLYCKDIAPQERSFWCVDPSRQKYMLRHNNMWNIDIEGKIFCDIVKETISKMYLDYTTELVNSGESTTSNQILSLREFMIDLLMTKKIPNCAKKYLICDQNGENKN